MTSGVYTLVLGLDAEKEIAIGRLGRIFFPRGYYAYTGSARGPGGLKRVERHLEVLRGVRKTRRWHIDYLLPETRFQEAVITRTAEDLECSIARKVGERLMPISGFGCTDCSCISHLHCSADLGDALHAVRQAHGQ